MSDPTTAELVAAFRSIDNERADLVSQEIVALEAEGKDSAAIPHIAAARVTVKYPDLAAEWRSAMLAVEQRMADAADEDRRAADAVRRGYESAIAERELFNKERESWGLKEDAAK